MELEKHFVANVYIVRYVATKNYLAMVKRLEELFYSVPEEDRDALVLQDPACKFNQKKLDVPSFVNHRIETSGALNPDEIFRQACLPAKKKL